MKANIIKSVVAFLGLSLLTASSYAAVIEYSSAFEANNTSNYASTTGSSLNDSATVSTAVTLDRFDASLGTLTGVEISFTSNWDHFSYASGYDSSTESQRHFDYRHCGFWSCHNHYYYTYSNDTQVDSSSYAQFEIELVDPYRSASVTSDSNHDNCSRSYSFSATASCNASTNDDDNTFNGTLDLSSFSLSQFVGTDDLDLNLNNYASLSGSCDNNDGGDSCSAYNDAFWDGKITVSYTYDAAPVPAPTTIVLMLMGLLGLSITRRNMA